MKSIISELFSDTISRAELVKPASDKYEKANHKKEKAGDKFLQSLSDEQKILFDSFLEAYHEVLALDDEEIFKHGVSLGVRITAESFLLSNESIT